MGEYNNLKAQYLSANNDQEQASNSLKGFGSFMHEPPDPGVKIFLLDNRKLYTFGQARVRTIVNNFSKDNACAAQLASQDEAKMSSDKTKSSKRNQKRGNKLNLGQRMMKRNLHL